MAILDSEGLIAGRLSSVVAKRLLKGETIIIVNAEKAIISGSKKQVVERFRIRFNLSAKGNPRKGPKFPRMPDRMLKRIIRGMLPFKRPTGKAAFKKLKVYMGVPDEFKGAKFEVVEQAKRPSEKKSIKLAEISKELGAKI